MRYLLLICTDEQALMAASAEEATAMTAEYARWMEDPKVQGALRGGERLRPSFEATTVQVRDGKVLTADGPFAETKEQIGGYFLVDCGDLDEAIALAGALPGARHGSIEVRPIWEM
jgi:hypothetical protein